MFAGKENEMQLNKKVYIFYDFIFGLCGRARISSF